MQFHILLLAYVIMVFSSGYGEVRGYTIASMKYSRKDMYNLISPSINITGNIKWKSYEDIICTIKYNNFWRLTSSWSYTAEYKDYSSGIFLVDYSLYGDSFKEFVKNYPTVTVTTYGEANSPETFGDVGSGKFGPLTYPTSVFMADENVYYENLVKAYADQFWTYYVNVEIKLGFKSQRTSLLLAPAISGYIIGVGAPERSLEFGLGVTKVTFNRLK